MARDRIRSRGTGALPVSRRPRRRFVQGDRRRRPRRRRRELDVHAARLAAHARIEGCLRVNASTEERMLLAATAASLAKRGWPAAKTAALLAEATPAGPRRAALEAAAAALA